MRKNIYIIIGVLVILLQIGIIIGIFQMDKYDRQNRAVESYNLLDKIEQVENKVTSLGKKIEKENSLISDSYFEIGEFDVNTFKYPLTFCVELKEYSNNTKVYLKFDERIIELEKRDNVFKKTIIADGTLKYEPNSIIIENNGVFQNQKLNENDNIFVNYYFEKLLPVITTDKFGGLSYGDFNNRGVMTIDYEHCLGINIYKESYDVDINKILDVKNLKCNVTINDKIIDKIDVLDKNNDAFDNFYESEIVGITDAPLNYDYLAVINKSYKLKKGDVIKFVLVAELKDGFSYEEIVDFYDTMNPDADMGYESNLTGKNLIKDANGKIIMEDINMMDRY